MNKKGFTMIELLVAVAIMGVLTIIAIPSVKTIQTNNRKTKYMAYEKSVKSASKMYADSFDEDLFGASNTGCTIVKYSELKEKDLVQDIQIKNTKCDQDSETFVYIIKAKNDNYGFFSNIVCRDGTEVVYSNKESKRKKCELEDGKGPDVLLTLKPERSIYYIGDTPKISIKISDSGVGLKSKQKMAYKWVTRDASGEHIVIDKIAKFNNKSYEESATVYLTMPDEKTIEDPITFYLLIDDVVYDANGTPTSFKKELPLKYFRGKINIKMKAGSGAKLVDGAHNTNYTIDSQGYIIRKPNDRIISKIRYGDSDDLWDYNNKDYINLEKAHYHIDAGEEWKDLKNGKVYSQTQKMTPKSFGFANDEVTRTKDETVEVEANWKKNKYTLTYDNDGGTGCTSVTKTYQEKWGPLCTPTKPHHKFTGWTGVKADDEVNCNKTAKATWKYTPEITISATDQSTTYDGSVLYANNECKVTSGSLASGETLSCSCSGSQSGSGSSTKTLSSVVIKNSSGTDITGDYVVTKKNGILSVSCNKTISGSLSAGSIVTYAGLSWTVVSADSSVARLAFNGYVDANANTSGSYGGDYYSSTYVVGVWLNKNAIMKDALASTCIANGGSSANTTYNAPAVEHWKTDSYVYVPRKVHSYSYTYDSYASSYNVDSDGSKDKTSASIIGSYPTGVSSDVAYKAGSAAWSNNGYGAITYPNSTVSNYTSGYLSNYVTVFNPYYVKNSGSLLYMYRWKKGLSESSWDEQKVGNTTKYRLHICGGSYHGKVYAIGNNDDTTYKYKLPTASDWDSTHRKIASNWHYAFAGWQAHVHLDGQNDSVYPYIKNYYFTDGLCEDQSVDSADRPDVSCTYNHCFTKTLKSISSTSYPIFYRPYIYVAR